MASGRNGSGGRDPEHCLPFRQLYNLPGQCGQLAAFTAMAFTFQGLAAKTEKDLQQVLRVMLLLCNTFRENDAAVILFFVPGWP